MEAALGLPGGLVSTPSHLHADVHVIHKYTQRQLRGLPARSTCLGTVRIVSQQGTWCHLIFPLMGGCSMHAHTHIHAHAHTHKMCMQSLSQVRVLAATRLSILTSCMTLGKLLNIWASISSSVT